MRVGLIFFQMLLTYMVRAQIATSTPDSLNLYYHPDIFLLDTTVFKKYPFIDLSNNSFRFYTAESPSWKHFFREFSAMTADKDRKLNIYHLGGSHLQADIYTHVFRTFLQTYWEDLCGERGQVFPFSIAGTNNPSNYKFRSTNKWKGFRSPVSRPANVNYGLSGIVATCADSIIQLSFKYDRTEVRSEFKSFRILHNKGTLPYSISILNGELGIKDIFTNEKLGYTEYLLNKEIDSLDLEFTRTSMDKEPLEIYGFTFLNDSPGCSYSAIGVNGASLNTYLQNGNFEEQLRIYPPDLFIFSVGTNDANVRYDQFDAQYYKNNLETLIQVVLRCNPDCAILLTVPNDSYFQKKYLNRNIERQQKVIIELAEKYKLAVWDVYSIMGEIGSAKTWQNAGLMQADLVHFTPLGYQIKGKLLIDAFLKFLEQMRNTEKMQ